MPYTRYYRGRMDGQEKEAYDALAEGILNFQEDISLPNLPTSIMKRVFYAVNFDYPEFFYVDFSQMRMRVGKGETSALMNYFAGASEARRLMNEIHRRAESITSACQSKRPLEIERLIHNELAHGCCYGSLPSRPEAAYSIRGALLDGICVCEGYAKAFKFLADQVKIQSLVIVGTATLPGKSEERHAWNMVNLNGNVYHLDVTFDRLVCNQYQSMSYFNLSDREIWYDHTPDPMFKMPVAPVSGAVIPTVSGTRQLMDYLKNEARRGEAYSEVRLTKGFAHEELMQMIRNRLEKEDYWWYNRIRAYVSGDGKKSLFILWK